MQYQNVDVELTEEQEAALKNLLPICKEREFEFTPEAMRGIPEKVRPVFVLRILSAIDKLDLQAAARGSAENDGIPLANGKYSRGVIERGVVGWKNFYALDGSEIVYNKTDVIELLGPSTALLLSLVVAILQAGQLTKEERLGLR